jgi:hypothetical protein
MKILTKKVKFMITILILILFLLTLSLSICYAQGAEVLIFGDDSRRDPICYSESMAKRAMRVAQVLPVNGTAFLVSPRNHILTAAHVLDAVPNFWGPLGEITLRFGLQATECGGSSIMWGPEVKLTSGDVIKINRDLDYALLKIPYEMHPFDDIAARGWAVRWLNLDPDTRLTQLADSEKGLYILANNPEFGKIMLSQDDECKITEPKADCGHLNDIGFNPPAEACVEHHCDGMQGNSGGPLLLNINGKVIGVESGMQIGFMQLGYFASAVKIRQIYPEIRDYLPTAEELADNDGDGMPNVRDNCPDVPNTGTCTSGKVGIINCLGNGDCDTSFGASDGVCTGSQLDSNSDGVGDACSTLPSDAFEPNDLPDQAGVLSPGSYALTLHDRLDTDFFKIPIPYSTNSFSIYAFYMAPDRDLAKWLTYQDCSTCPSVLAPGTFEYSNSGWRYTETGAIPAGRTYLLELYELEKRGPLDYSLIMMIGGEELPPDDNEPNDTVAQATVLSGCDYTGLINIQNASDVDYYKIEALGYSVNTRISFDPNEGNLDLFLDGVQATSSTDDGSTKTVEIIGCGKSPSYVKVQGQPNFYNICINRVSAQEGCPGYIDLIPFVGSGTFHFRQSNLYAPGFVERTIPVNKQMFAGLKEETATSATWWLYASVDYGQGFNQLVMGKLEIPKTYTSDPVSFGPISSSNPWILKEAVPGRVAWYQVPPVGHGEGTFEGTVNAITAFSVTSDGLQWNESLPGDLGTLIMQGKMDTDGDGIPDEVEIETGTDPYSDDTDGDGLADGTEDANQNGQVDYLTGETDPRLWDTDEDGVSDGVEKGLTSPQGKNTDPGKFVPDLDPATTTDPTRKDTDGDGLSDGEEDANYNGRVDPGETSPIISNVITTVLDLIVESLTHSPASPTTLNTITFTAVVKNIGNATAGPSTLNFKIGGETFGQDFAIPGLTPGEIFTVQRQELLGVAQNYRNTVMADSNNEVIETMEDNNQKTDDYTVTRAGDFDGDNDVDQNDVNILLSYRNKPASACPTCDLDGDGMITALDARKLVLLCTRPRCATQ